MAKKRAVKKKAAKKKRATGKRANQKGRTAPQLPGIEDDLPGPLVVALEEWSKSKTAKKNADKRHDEAGSRVLERLREAGIERVRSPCGEFVFEITQSQSVKRRKIAKDERPTGDENAFDKG